MLILRAKGWRDASTETPRHGAYLPEGIWSVAPLFLEKNNKQQDHHLPRTLSSAPGSVIIGVPLHPFGTLAPGDAPGLGIRPSSPGLSLSPPPRPHTLKVRNCAQIVEDLPAYVGTLGALLPAALQGADPGGRRRATSPCLHTGLVGIGSRPALPRFADKPAAELCGIVQARGVLQSCRGG